MTAEAGHANTVAMPAPPRPLLVSRRTLLKSGLYGIAAVAVGSTALALQGTRLRGQAPQKLAALDADEYAVLAAIAARIAPELGAGAPGADALGIALKIDSLISGASDEVKQGFKIILRVFENGLTGTLFGERTRPFTALSPSEQDRTLEQWRDSSVGFRRTAYHALYSIVSAFYWGNEQTWARIGYPGPPNPANLRAMYAENLVDLAPLRAGSAPAGH